VPCRLSGAVVAASTLLRLLFFYVCFCSCGSHKAIRNCQPIVHFVFLLLVIVRCCLFESRCLLASVASQNLSALSHSLPLLCHARFFFL
jgi:hypothetical protein